DVCSSDLPLERKLPIGLALADQDLAVLHDYRCSYGCHRSLSYDCDCCHCCISHLAPRSPAANSTKRRSASWNAAVRSLSMSISPATLPFAEIGAQYQLFAVRIHQVDADPIVVRKVVF